MTTYLKKSTILAELDNGLTCGVKDPVYALMHTFGGADPTNPARLRARMHRLYNEWVQKRQAETTAGPDHPEVPPVTGGTMEAPDVRREPASGKTFVLTCAQNNTDLIPDEWWATLLNLVDYYDAELHVSRFTYNKGAYGQKSVKPGSKKRTDAAELMYDPRIAPYVSDTDVQLTPDLVWLGSVQILPTAVNPITGFQTHTRQASAILPHTKMAMESVPTMKDDPARFIYTTGAITQRNYIQKAAGQKADFHHVFGALLVEVDDDGNWWARQLNFDQSGGLHDLNRFFTPTEVFEDVRVQAVTHGDIHGWKRDHMVCNSVFKEGGMLDVLMPREQFFHDIIDFMPRNHHNRNDFQFLRAMHVANTSNVKREFTDIAEWLMNRAYRQWCASFVVVSNHDQAVNGWLADRNALDDPENMKTWLEQNLALATYPNHHPFHAMLHAACRLSQRRKEVPTVLREDSSYKILGKIEAALHGHLGPNGARGAPRNLKTAGKANTGHTHSAGIVEGVYTAGVLGMLDMGYNRGLSSWSHSSILTHPNAKRQILTLCDGKWWRDQ